MGEGVGAHGRSANRVEGAGHGVDDPLAGLAERGSGGDSVFTVDVVVAPATRRELERRVPVFVAATAHQLGEGGSGAII